MLHLAVDTVTVINRRYDSVTGKDEYTYTVVNNVSWYGTVAAIVELSGLRASDSYIIRFPVESLTGYVDPIAFAQTGIGWTLATGDIIVKGAVPNTLKPADIQRGYYTYATIRSTTDDRRAPNAPHIKVTAV